jgi:spermidine synthase
MLVANLAGATAERIDHLRMMAQAFSDNVLLVPVEGEGNEIAIAFKDPALAPRLTWSPIRQRANILMQQLGLDFPRFARRLERSHKLGYLRRTLSYQAKG